MASLRLQPLMALGLGLVLASTPALAVGGNTVTTTASTSGTRTRSTPQGDKERWFVARGFAGLNVPGYAEQSANVAFYGAVRAGVAFQSGLQFTGGIGTNAFFNRTYQPLMISVGARYNLAAHNRAHFFGELDLDLYLYNLTSFVGQLGGGVSAMIGLEMDITPFLSLEVAPQLFVEGGFYGLTVSAGGHLGLSVYL